VRPQLIGLSHTVRATHTRTHSVTRICTNMYHGNMKYMLCHTGGGRAQAATRLCVHRPAHEQRPLRGRGAAVEEQRCCGGAHFPFEKRCLWLQPPWYQKSCAA